MGQRPRRDREIRNGRPRIQACQPGIKGRNVWVRPASQQPALPSDTRTLPFARKGMDPRSITSIARGAGSRHIHAISVYVWPRLVCVDKNGTNGYRQCTEAKSQQACIRLYLATVLQLKRPTTQQVYPRQIMAHRARDSLPHRRWRNRLDHKQRLNRIQHVHAMVPRNPRIHESTPFKLMMDACLCNHHTPQLRLRYANDDISSRTGLILRRLAWQRQSHGAREFRLSKNMLSQPMERIS